MHIPTDLDPQRWNYLNFATTTVVYTGIVDPDSIFSKKPDPDRVAYKKQYSD